MRRRTVFLALVALGICGTCIAKTPKGESIELKSAAKSVLNVSVDGVPVKVTRYVDNYVSAPNRPEDQKINIYIPENATKASPIIFYVNNAGWQANAYPEGTIRDGGEYDGTSDKVGVALKEGYVVVSYGGRSRGNGLTGEKYLGHSPAIMTDTKAAIRYLRHNKKALPAGDTEKIIITGTSGGGALSTVVAASGNSEDYFPSLYEIGAAGIRRNPDGSFTSDPGYGDNVFGVIAYCPITDLGHGCAAYEWLFHDTRKVMYLTGEMNYPSADERTVMAASEQLSSMYADYIDGLGLRDKDGELITSSNLRDHIAALMKEEIAKSIVEFGIDKMKEDLTQEIRQRGFFGGAPGGGRPQGNGAPRMGGGMPQGQGAPQMREGQNAQSSQSTQTAAQRRVSNGWVTFGEDGSFTYDLDKHLYYLAKYTTLKVAPAFSNSGLYSAGQNEDSLFGSEYDEYSPFNEYSWNNDCKENGVGKDDTGLSWKEFLSTPEGERLSLQIKMTCAMDYLLEGKSDTAPFWYVRHGMDDRDASFAVEATLFNAVMSSGKVKASDVGFAWLKPHSGDYDVAEAYSWLKGVLAK